MRSALLYLLGAVFLALIVSVAWWSREFREPVGVQTYTVEAGDTLEELAQAFNVVPSELAEANGITEGALEPGRTIVIPERELTLSEQLGIHAAGLAAETIGVFLSFWLGIVAGILPRGVRRQILGISVVLGIASYAGAQASSSLTPQLTPQFLFASLKDGFAWSAAFPLFARAFGVRGAEPPATRSDPTPESESGKA